MRLVLFIMLFFSLTGAPARAGIDEAMAALEKKDFGTALEELRPLAAAGDPGALAMLGTLFLYGNGVEKNEKKAAALFRRAAEGGLAFAQVAFGIMLRDGKGVEKDEKAAFDWLLKAAKQDNYTAQLWLAALYESGQGVEVDFVKAYMWALLATAQKGDPSVFANDPGFNVRNQIIKKQVMTPEQILAAQRMARDWVSSRNAGIYSKGVEKLIDKASSGDAETQYKVAQRYLMGRQVVQDHKEAIRWLLKAAAQGHDDAQARLGGHYLTGAVVPKDEATALGWYRKSAEQGNEFGQAGLGILYRDGLGVARDPVRAHMWLNLAASHEILVRNNQEKRSPLYHRDQLTPSLNAAQIKQTHEMATAWMGKNEPDRLRKALDKHWTAANDGDGKAQIEIGKLYYEGKSVPQSYAEALYWFRSAAGKGEAGAKFWLGLLYESGHGVTKDETAASNLYRQGAELDPGDAKAQFSLGTYYLLGRAVEKNATVAAKWYLAAAEQGLRVAQLGLSRLYASGEGVEQNYISAYKWCRIVYESGAPTQIFKMVKSVCKDVARKMSPADGQKAIEAVKQWMATHPRRAMDSYWMGMMGTDKFTFDPNSAIIVR